MINQQNVQVKNGSTWDKICPFPVGYVYMSTNSTSPASTYGGTWTSLTGGYYLRAAGAWGSGGSNTITVQNLPAHNHSASTSSAGAHTHAIGGDDDTQYAYNGNTSLHRAGTSGASRTVATSSSGVHTHTVSVGNTGGGSVLSNLPKRLLLVQNSLTSRRKAVVLSA